MVISAGAPVSDGAAKLARLIARKGKVLDPARGELHSEIGPTGALPSARRLITGRAGATRKKAIIFNSSETLLVAHWICAEIRNNSAER
jgi:hypothetical protein